MTINDGCLGSHDDEEHSEMCYVMRIADMRVIKFLNAHCTSSREGVYLFECLVFSTHVLSLLLIERWSLGVFIFH